MSAWRALGALPSELRLDITLKCGQSFTWRQTSPNEWTNVLQGRIVSLRQTDDDVFFREHSGAGADCSSGADGDASTDVSGSAQEATTFAGSDPLRAILADYFQLGISVEKLYTEWSARDKNFAVLKGCLPGIRMLRQDPTENLFSFICSSNNNISRISLMVDTLRRRYGKFVADAEGESWHTFPTVEALARDGIEEELRSLGFGYRAKFIHQTAQQLVKTHGPGRAADRWLASLRDVPYEEAHAALQQLPGVGPKVADCICLMSLDKTGAIPVDTHVWAIAQQYMTITGKTLTSRIYADIGNFFRELHGPYAGWAHSVLFSADLRQFQDRVAGQKPSKAKAKANAKTKAATAAAVGEVDGAADHGLAKKKVKGARGKAATASTSVVPNTKQGNKKAPTTTPKTLETDRSKKRTPKPRPAVKIEPMADGHTDAAEKKPRARKRKAGESEEFRAMGVFLSRYR